MPTRRKTPPTPTPSGRNGAPAEEEPMARTATRPPDEAVGAPADGTQNGQEPATPTPAWRELGLTEDTLREMYYFMLLARLLDERMWLLNRQGKAPFVISCQGHEAIQIGVCMAMERGKD